MQPTFITARSARKLDIAVEQLRRNGITVAQAKQGSKIALALPGKSGVALTKPFYEARKRIWPDITLEAPFLPKNHKIRLKNSKRINAAFWSISKKLFAQAEAANAPTIRANDANMKNLPKLLTQA